MYKVRIFKSTRKGYYFGAFVRWDNTNAIISLATGQRTSLADALVALFETLIGFPPVMLIEPMGFCEKELVFKEIRIPVTVVSDFARVPVIIAI